MAEASDGLAFVVFDDFVGVFIDEIARHEQVRILKEHPARELVAMF